MLLETNLVALSQGFSPKKLGKSLGLTFDVKDKRKESSNRPFPSSPGSLFQNEVKFSAFDMKMIFNSHTNKTHFYKKG